MSAKKKFHIIFDFDNSKGGGTSFLSFLRSELIKRNLYTDKWYKADSILANSHHLSITKAFFLKNFPFKKIRIVHRIDGPMRIYNHPADRRDDKVILTNQQLADATVFQSEWSHKEHEKLYGPVKSQTTIIRNVANPNFFKPVSHKFQGEKFKLISTVWSTHKNKGFETYDWLDNHLDFSKFSFEIIGAPLGKFKNIQSLPYMAPQELGKKLRDAHAFIFPSRYEACSNALLEALATGLPCITYAGSSNTEIIKDSELWFKSEAEIPELLRKISKNYESFLPKALPSAEDTVERYIEILRG